jgi:3-oxocholest-4-en-26-oate---CoA ligase
MEFNVAVLHQAIAEAVPDQECIVWRTKRSTWAQTAERVRRFSNLLSERSIGVHGDPGGSAPWDSPHDHLGIYMHNGPEYIEAVLGAHLARVAPFNINYRYVGTELEQLLHDAQPRVLMFHACFAPVIERLLPSLGAETLLLQVGDDSDHDLLPGAIEYEASLGSASAEPPADPPSADDLHIVYTGGTTGLPKGVLWRIGDVVAGPLQLARRDGTEFESVGEVVAVAVKRVGLRILSTPPYMHGAGLWVALTAMVSGGTLVIQDTVDRFDAREIAELCERERVVILSLVGDAMGRPFVDALESGDFDVSSIKFVNNGAAPMSTETKSGLKRHIPGLLIEDGLGSSEAGNLGRRATGETFTLSPGSVLLSEDFSSELQPGSDEVGWLCTATRHARGYLRDQAKTEATFRTWNGRSLVVSGDRARIRADGTIELLGRDSMTINSGGEKIFVEEVEAVLRRIDGVADALVVGRPHDRWGSEVVAVIEFDSGAVISDHDLRDAASKELARYKLPRAFVHVDKVRRAPNGKADYGWARDQASSSASTAPD